ncbi:MAG TPA: hypothetical protein VFE46_03305 [Pirellulales bacterium]|jgi:hypothetical protein|nr:hypothetical protein [Pirellulales bacterium]
MITGKDLIERVRQYLNLIGPDVKLKEFLGDGTDGAVWATSNDTAIKIFAKENGYFNERDAYLRLAEFGVTEKIDGFWIPRMIRYDDTLLVIEMDLMQHPPYIIDFAKVRIDRPPDFSEQTIEYENQQGLERFGKNWPRVQRLMQSLESFQIYYLDPSPSNIVFPLSSE